MRPTSWMGISREVGGETDEGMGGWGEGEDGEEEAFGSNLPPSITKETDQDFV